MFLPSYILIFRITIKTIIRIYKHIGYHIILYDGLKFPKAIGTDPDQTPHFAAFDLGLHCLRMSQKRVSSLKRLINIYFCTETTKLNFLLEMFILSLNYCKNENTYERAQKSHPSHRKQEGETVYRYSNSSGHTKYVKHTFIFCLK